MGDHATALAIGWDRASVLLNVLAKGRWTRYRLPRASHTFDQAWYTEWPRIREVETERFIIDMHGLFYDAPRLAYGGRYWGLKPISQHLRMVPDFCTWRGMLVMAGDQGTAVTGNDHMMGEPQSNLWFGKTDDLWAFGKPAGWGGPWQDTPVKAGQVSDPFLMTGFEHKCLHLAHDAGRTSRSGSRSISWATAVGNATTTSPSPRGLRPPCVSRRLWRPLGPNCGRG